MPGSSTRQAARAAASFSMVVVPTVGTSTRMSCSALATLISVHPPTRHSRPARSIIASVPSSASTAITSRSSTAIDWPMSNRRRACATS